MPTLMNIDEAYHWMLEQRGVETKCKDCSGWGVKTYPNTAGWRGGVGGMTPTNGVCDRCWGSGDEHRRWLLHRFLKKST